MGCFSLLKMAPVIGSANQARLKAFNPQPEVDGWASRTDRYLYQPAGYAILG